MDPESRTDGCGFMKASLSGLTLFSKECTFVNFEEVIPTVCLLGRIYSNTPHLKSMVMVKKCDILNNNSQF